MALIELACRSADCAPPPTGTGGSKPSGSYHSSTWTSSSDIPVARTIPYSLGQSEANLRNYKGDFKVPGAAKIKEIVGATTLQQVHYFKEEHGIDLTIDDWAASSDFTNQRYGALFALDAMARRYPETMRDLPVDIKMSGGFGDVAASFTWPPADPDRRITVEMNATWVLDKGGTPNEKRRLYAAAVIHEVGHALTYDAMDRDVDAFQGLMFSDEAKIGDATIKRGTAWQSVSQYGASNIAEDIAESFTAHVLGIDPPDDVGRDWVKDRVAAIAASAIVSPDSLIYKFAIAERGEPVVAALIELACHTSACRPPTSGGTGGSSPAVGTISTRAIKAKNAEKPITGLGTRLSEVPLAVAVSQAAAIAKNVVGFAELAKHPGITEGASEADQKAFVTAVVSQMSDNIVEVFDRSPNPEITRLWYDAANRLAQDWAVEYNMHPDAVAAVIAAMSPQNPWENNIAQARAVLETMKDPERVITSDELHAVNGIIVQQYDKRVQTWKNAIAKAEREGRIESAEKKRANPPKSPKLLDTDATTRLRDLNNLDAAYFVRHVVGEGKDAPTQRIMTPTADGGYEFGEAPKNNDGSDKHLVWMSYPPIRNAISVIRDPSVERVSAAMGGAHKVRSFYNNMAYPNDANHVVTGDTPTFGVSFRTPVGSNHTLISTKEGAVNIYGRPTNAAAGTQGVHILVAEAHRVAARRINRRTSTTRKYLPREIQSVTWEQWRYDYPAATRTGKGANKGSIARVEAVLRSADADPKAWPDERVQAELATIRGTLKLEQQS